MANMGAINRAMRAFGYTRQWKYKRDRRCWREEDALENDLRWCLCCGRDLPTRAKVSAMYCSAGCRVAAMRKRRARGVYPGYMAKGPICTSLDLNVSELARRRHEAFYLCHGKTIDQAPAVCPHWRALFPDE